ncbi:hypothetical protein [Saccharopolyspora sp. NPDC002376]
MADRLTGVSQALVEAGLSIEDVSVIEEAVSRDGGTQVMWRILDDHPQVTAVIALSSSAPTTTPGVSS